jgi:hypothetical protein
MSKVPTPQEYIENLSRQYSVSVDVIDFMFVSLKKPRSISQFRSSPIIQYYVDSNQPSSKEVMKLVDPNIHTLEMEFPAILNYEDSSISKTYKISVSKFIEALQEKLRRIDIPPEELFLDLNDFYTSETFTSSILEINLDRIVSISRNETDDEYQLRLYSLYVSDYNKHKKEIQELILYQELNGKYSA